MSILKLLNLVFNGPLAPSIGVNGPSFNSLEKCMISLIQIIHIA